MHQKEREQSNAFQYLKTWSSGTWYWSSCWKTVWYDWIKSQHWLWQASTYRYKWLPRLKWLCISTDWFFPSCPTVWLGLCDRISFVNPLSFLHLFFLFFLFFLLLPMAALVNSALSVTPFSSDSLAFEKMAVCVLTCCSCCWCESKLLQNSWHSQVHWLLWLVSVSIPFSVTQGGGKENIFNF